MLIDTHAHLLKKYYDNVDELITSYENLVVVNCGSNSEDNQEILAQSEKHANLYGTLGIHPHHADEWSEEFKNFIMANQNHEKIVAIGEIGLDYFKQQNYEKQRQVFEAQLKLAAQLNKPVVIHSRDALEDTLEIIARYPTVKKVIHSFSYDCEAAQRFIAANCYIGVNGIVTFKKNEPIASVVREIDLNYFLLETDSPYLAPVPYRGKQNDSSKVVCVLEKIAEIKGLSVEAVQTQTNANAWAFFDF